MQLLTCHHHNKHISIQFNSIQIHLVIRAGTYKTTNKISLKTTSRRQQLAFNLSLANAIMVD